MKNMKSVCDERPCVLQFRDSDGVHTAVFDDQESEVEHVFKCSHQAYAMAAEIVCRMAAAFVAGELDMDEVLTLGSFHLKYVDEVEHVEDAKKFLSKFLH